MKKKIKSQDKLFGTEVKFIMSNKPSPPPSKLALRKLAEANEILSRSKYKSVEEMLKGIDKNSSHK
jgi:hypothetical protein